MERKRVKRYRWMIGLVIMISALWYSRSADAAQIDVTPIYGMDSTASVSVGDTGVIAPNTDGLTDYMGQPVTVDSWYWISYDSSVVTVDTNGTYQALKAGNATVQVSGYSQSSGTIFTFKCIFQVAYDMSGVTLSKDTITGYVTQYESVVEDIRINSSVVFDMSNSKMTYVSSNDKMNVSVSLYDNTLHVEAYSPGSTTVTINLNDKVFTIHINITKIEISRRSYVSSKGKKITLKVKGIAIKPVWSSSNSKVAKVSSRGVVRLRKYGNAVITADINGKKVGCAVSVVSSKLLKVVRRAVYIGSNWKYSQPKRMQSGYYDCSSLVWKAYSRMGKKIGLSYYAPVAADLAKWCKQHGKVLTKSYTRNHIQKMKFRPGDLMFETGKKNGRYKGIYHVEMFTGYAVSHYDETGKPVINELWAARPEGYYGGGHLMERP